MSTTVLITGASSGIGYELARLFARDGFGIVMVANDAAKLADAVDRLRSEYSSVTLKIIACDLSDSQSPGRVFEEVHKATLTIDVLVNNAGFGLYGPFVSTDGARELQMLDVNVRTLTHLTKLFLPGMLERGRGRILNLASIAAFQPGPLMAVYYASKAYVLSFSEALAEELMGTGVTVTALCPGTTRTAFEKTAQLQQSKLFKSRVMDAATVAHIGYDGLMAGKRIVVPGFLNQMFAFLPRITPRRLITRVVRYMQSPM